MKDSTLNIFQGPVLIFSFKIPDLYLQIPGFNGWFNIENLPVSSLDIQFQGSDFVYKIPGFNGWFNIEYFPVTSFDVNILFVPCSRFHV